MKRKENRFTAKSKCSCKTTAVSICIVYLFLGIAVTRLCFSLELPTTKLGDLIENRVNSFLSKENCPGNVTIRVVSSFDKQVEVKPGMKSRSVKGFKESKKIDTIDT